MVRTANRLLARLVPMLQAGWLTTFSPCSPMERRYAVMKVGYVAMSWVGYPSSFAASSETQCFNCS